MILTLIILAYILNVFATRWINKKLYKLCEYNPIVPLWWFIPIVAFIALSVVYIVDTYKDRGNWFTGKNW